MAWFVHSSFVDRTIEMLHSEAVQQIGVTDELSELENTMSSIKARLSDAEEKEELVDHRLFVDLEKVEELVDDLSSEALRQQLAGTLRRDSITKKVCTFFSTSSNQAASQYKLGEKIKGINKILARLKASLLDSGLVERHEENIDVVTRGKEPTPSYVHKEQVIIGRDRDTTAIKRYLFDVAENSEEKNVEVIPIVGARGIGKTTLAQLVFHDEEVVMHFDLRLWVNLSSPLDERVGIGKIVKSATNEDFESLETYQLQQKLGKIVRGKRYLLVLDDVLNWDPNGDPWTSLQNLSSGCANGSRIIITSSHWDAEIEITKSIGTTKPYELEPLDEEESWALFEKVVFENGEGKQINSQIVKRIVERCAGSPFAIKTIGRMLQSKDPETEWSTFLETDIISRIHGGDLYLLEALILVWDNFPWNLKNCLAYCSLFPIDFEIDVKTLINLWIAQGFIYPSPERHMEDVGYEYFRNLCWESIFQEVEKDENGIVSKCRMAPLMHQFVIEAAESISIMLYGTQYLETSERELQWEEHVSFGFHLDSSSNYARLPGRGHRIRTILLPSQMRLETEGTLGESFLDAIILRHKLLRVLDLHNLGIEMLPDSIGKLKHLRYLDVSQNSAIKSLPNSITMLLHLTVLKLSSCYGLQELPRDIHKLIRLRHVEIDWCYSLTYLPRGLGHLTQLQTLSEFVLSKDNRHSCSLRQLAELNNLRGKLKIKNLENDIYDSKAAILKEKEHLTSLTLAWDLDVHEVTAKEQLDRLEPPSNIKELVLVRYHGIKFSGWFSSLNNLVKFSLRNCKCQDLPPLSHLSSLKVLILDQMTDLKYISNKYENNHPSSSSASAAAAAFFPSLEELRLTELPNLEGWWGGDNSLKATVSSLPSFPRLSKLMIEDCPKLSSMPLYTHLKEWLVLDNTSLETFQHIMNPFTSSQVPSETNKEWSAASTSSAVFASSSLSRLQSLCIIGIKKLDISYSDEIKWEGLRNLRFLRFDYLPKLNKLPEGLQHVTTLQELHIWRCNMKTLPEWIGKFKFLTVLGISVCPYLNSLPEAIKSLSSLVTLEIVDCPILLERCKSKTGADWHKIEHIPDLLLQRPQSSSSSSSGQN
ncbi:putative disease resistance protein RGA1 [Ziziphus jujuba]|uniref:Disease resistance protein RGA1 n=1 Tax=Ziziphus jujuba TaxID=326968 RepID=A0ABM4A0K3_ZIZJJ|nr:putative disease resistance protein RGA1 [Ziziphus jujuba]